jgi:hypothetical protein
MQIIEVSGLYFPQIANARLSASGPLFSDVLRTCRPAANFDSGLDTTLFLGS